MKLKTIPIRPQVPGGGTPELRQERHQRVLRLHRPEARVGGASAGPPPFATGSFQVSDLAGPRGRSGSLQRPPHVTSQAHRPQRSRQGTQGGRMGGTDAGGLLTLVLSECRED